LLEELQTSCRKHNSGDPQRFFARVVARTNSSEDRRRLETEWGRRKPEQPVPAALTELMRKCLREADEIAVDRLRKRLDDLQPPKEGANGAGRHLLELEYLEALHPDAYTEALAWQPFPAGDVAQLLDAFAEVKSAYCSGGPHQFAGTSREFQHTLQTSRESLRQPDAGPFPGDSTLTLELLFNRLQPFRWAWVLMLGALAVLGVSLAWPTRLGYDAGLVLYGLSLACQVWGFYVRIQLSGRAPISNMYETVIFVAFMAAVLALVFELRSRKTVLALAGAVVACLGLILADQLPLSLDPSISPIVPILRSNYWLTVHVITIVCSYAAGTLAWGLGNLVLGLAAFGKADPAALKTLSRFTYRTMQVAVLLLAAGTFLGGWWAAESWGRFWGWDPKEVGALIALVCYVIPLHARYLGWVGDFGLAVAAVLCYASILLSWYVINFVFAAGLHSYGFSSGGGLWVLWAVLLNLAWLLLASLVFLRRQPEGAA
jgi:ABC-type transport system involved in cytochrome c biogenesis permease subunit